MESSILYLTATWQRHSGKAERIKTTCLAWLKLPLHSHSFRSHTSYKHHYVRVINWNSEVGKKGEEGLVN
jgi:hypothetical protein